MKHTSNLIMWSLCPMDDNIVLFEAAVPTDQYTGLSANFKNGVRVSYKLLQVFIHLN